MTKLSNTQIAEKAAQKLREYIEINETFPMYQGQLNKTKIMKELGINLSSKNSNPAIKTLLNELQDKIAGKDSKRSESISSNELELQNEISYLREKLLRAEAALELRERSDFAEAFNVRTGKLIYIPENEDVTNGPKL